MEDWIIHLVEWGHYWGVGLLMLLETVFPPIPSEVIMTVAGVSAARGNMNLGGTIAAGTAGAMLGNWMWYWLAIKFGEARMRRFIDRYSRWLTLDWAEIERGQALFRKHGSIIVLVARMLPTLRSLISIPAGLFGMSLARFLFFFDDRNRRLDRGAGWRRISSGFAVQRYRKMAWAIIDRRDRRHRPDVSLAAIAVEGYARGCAF
jgi:membrane protein DedA with SNARE-associated domain